MKTATLEVLEPGEKVLGSKTAGSYFVREFVDPEVWNYNEDKHIS